MKILIVTRRFFPHGDATSSVVFNIAEALLRRGAEVHVAAVTCFEEDSQIKEWQGIVVKNIYRKYTKPFFEFIKYCRQKPLCYGEYLFSFGINQVIKKRMTPKYSCLKLDPILADAYLSFFDREIAVENYDLCLVTIMPHEAVWAAMKSNAKLKYAILQLDTYWNNELFSKRRAKDRLAFEKRMVEFSAFTLTTPIIFRENVKLFPQLREKLIPIEFPMIRRPAAGEETGKKRPGLHCVFLGTLYSKLRPPERVVHFISKIDDQDIVFDFYGFRQDLVSASPDYQAAAQRIVLHGSVSSLAAEDARRNADVLVNIDNTCLLQVPSKIFEYFSTGKPIINFYFDENSPTLAYFKDYPLSLNVNVNTMRDDEIPRLMTLFREQSCHRRLSFDEIKRIYRRCTPEYVVDQIMAAYEETEKENE